MNITWKVPRPNSSGSTFRGPTGLPVALPPGGPPMVPPTHQGSPQGICPGGGCCTWVLSCSCTLCTLRLFACYVEALRYTESTPDPATWIFWWLLHTGWAGWLDIRVRRLKPVPGTSQTQSSRQHVHTLA